MTADDRLGRVFAASLDMDLDAVRDSLVYNGVPEWDSIAHMTLVANIEHEFDVMLETDDILDMSSVSKAKEILRRHGIAFE
jgi:acyl carrier protein